MDQIINSFKEKRKLNDIIWDGVGTDQVKLKSEIRTKLMEIAEAFVESFKLESVEVEDILFLGSLAGYNWSRYSDVDLHILIDKSSLKGDKTLVDEFFDAKKEIFNNEHDITVKGFEVELYVQDVNEDNASNGVYSVLYNRWEKVPEPEHPDVDKKAVIKKVKEFNKQLSTIRGMPDSQNKLDKLQNLKDKIRKKRKAAIDINGEFATENLVFKYLRRAGFMEELADLKIEVADALLSLNENRL